MCGWLGAQVGGIRRLIVPVELGYPDNDFNKKGPKPSTFSASPCSWPQASPCSFLEGPGREAAVKASLGGFTARLLANHCCTLKGTGSTMQRLGYPIHTIIHASAEPGATHHLVFG